MLLPPRASSSTSTANRARKALSDETVHRRHPCERAAASLCSHSETAPGHGSCRDSMSKTKVCSHLLQLVDSDSEDGIGGHPLDVAPSTKKPTKQKHTIMPPKKAKAGRQAANKVTKPAPKTSISRRRSSDRMAAVAEENTVSGKTGAEKKKSSAKTEAGHGRGHKRAVPAEDEAGDEEDTVMTDAPAPAVETPPATKRKGARGRPKKVVVEAEPETSGARRGRKAAKRTDPDTTVEEVSEIPETQQPDAIPSDIDYDHEDLTDLPVPQSSSRKPGRGGIPVPSSVSKRPLSSPDKDGPALRRRIGELTQKYESLELKYRDLKEIAVKDAERNFDRLRKQTEEKSKAADQLIATLKAELAAQKEATKEIQRLQAQLSASESKAETLQSKLTTLTTSLAESKSEIKSLNLKLTAARNAEAAATAASAAKVPGSAMKGSSAAASRLAAANASEATLAAQKKEDLYGDLTGLIVRSVKRESGEDVFDCIQTGRNGTLHFKLAIDIGHDDSNSGGGSGGAGEAHCHYTPQLDANRDRALIAVLPGYLVDEISFPQAQAGKFYARVLKALNEAAEA
ncbi:hypothetical protein VTI74DRAFT_39 [Chaetomium olivicolor]